MRVLPGLLLLGALWGLSPSVAKVGLAMSIPPLGFGFCAALGSGIALLVLGWAQGARFRVTPAYLRHYAANGLAGYALANLVAYAALPHIPAGFFALLMPLVPMLTVAAAAALRHERLTRRRIVGTALGFAGVAVAMAPGAALPGAGLLGWALFAALTPLCYAVANLLAVRLAPAGAAPLGLAAGALLAAALFLGVGGLAAEQIPFRAPPAAVAILAGQAVLTATAYLLYFRMMRAAGSVVTSQAGYLISIFGILWGAILFGERMGWLAVPAAALVFAGLFLVSRK
jgi:drug/metabolite transporter (DMT)-like permease